MLKPSGAQCQVLQTRSKGRKGRWYSTSFCSKYVLRTRVLSQLRCFLSVVLHGHQNLNNTMVFVMHIFPSRHVQNDPCLSRLSTPIFNTMTRTSYLTTPTMTNSQPTSPGSRFQHTLNWLNSSPIVSHNALRSSLRTPTLHRHVCYGVLQQPLTASHSHVSEPARVLAHTSLWPFLSLGNPYPDCGSLCMRPLLHIGCQYVRASYTSCSHFSFPESSSTSFKGG